MEDHSEKSKPLWRKRFKKPKSLDFVGWGSKNLMEFLESLGRDTTNKISEYDVTNIVRRYVRELNVPSKKKKTKVVACDEKLSLLFGCQKINMAKLPDLVAKHYVENQEDDDDVYRYLYSSEDDDKKKERLCLADDKVVKKKPKGSVAAIVRENVKLVYLRKSLVVELAKMSEAFESKVVGSFVRTKKPCQLVHVTGVKEGNLIDGHFLQVTNYCYYLKDVASSELSDDDFTQEECEELHQRMKNGSLKRLTVEDMEEKVRSLHEDVTKHWIAKELELLGRKINQASEKGWKRELSQYLDRRELLSNPEEQSRLLLEVPEVIAEEIEPECVVDDASIEDDFMELNPVASIEARQEEGQQLKDSPELDLEELEPECVVDDVNMEDDFMEPNTVASIEPHQEEGQQLKDSPELDLEELEPECVDDDVKVKDDFMETNPEASIETPKLPDEEDQPTSAASAGEQPEDNNTSQNKDSISEEPQAQPNPIEIIELSDDDEEEYNDNKAYEKYDPKKKMWCYELPKGQTNGPFSLANFKEWSEQEYFVDVPDFKIWMIGESSESGVLLTKLLPHIKS